LLLIIDGRKRNEVSRGNDARVSGAPRSDTSTTERGRGHDARECRKPAHQDFSAGASDAGDFGTPLLAIDSVIFLLTSFCVGSYIQLVATIHRCKIPCRMERENRFMATKKKAKKKSSKKH
jgi:hypothetical protein